MNSLSNMQKGWNKILISIFAGVLCLALSPFGISSYFGNIRIDIPWSWILPIIISMAYGWRYGLLAGLSGGAYHPFVLWPDNGWANLLTTGAFLGYYSLIGIVASQIRQWKVFEVYIRIILANALFFCVLACIYSCLFNITLQFNPPFWVSGTIGFIEPKTLFNFAVKDVLGLVFLCLASETFLHFPRLRKVLGLSPMQNMAKNGAIISISFTISLIIWVVYVLMVYAVTHEKNILFSVYTNTLLFLLLCCGLIVARVFIYYFEKQSFFQGQAQKNEQKFRLLFENANDAIFLMKHHVFIDCNQQTLEMFGVARNKIIGQSPYNFSPEYQPNGEPSKEMSLQYIHLALKKLPQRFEWQHCRHNKSIFDAEVSLNCVEIDGETLIQAIVRDVTDTKQHEKVLREKEQRIRAMYDLSFQFIGLLSPEGILLEANQTSLRFAGVEPNDVIGKPFYNTPWWNHSEEAQNKLRDAIIEGSKGRIVYFETKHPDTEGKIHTVDFSIKPVYDENGKIIFLIPEGHDITHIKEAEALLLREIQFNKAIIDASPAFFVAISLTGEVIMMNPTMCKALGYLPGEAIGLKYLENFVLPEDAPEVEKIFATLKEKKCSTINENRVISKSKKIIEVEWHGVPVFNNKQVDFFIGIGIELTDRRKAEQMLIESEAFRRRIFESSRIAIVVMEPNNFNFIDCNMAAVQLYGCLSKNELLGKTPVDFSPAFQYAGEPSAIKAKAFFEKAMNEGSIVFEWRQLNPNGHEWDAEIHLLSFSSGNKTYLQFSLIDITERKQIEQALRNSELRLQKLLNSVTDYIFSVRIAHNKTIETIHGEGSINITGYTPAEFFAEPMLWFNIVHNDDKELVKDQIDAILSNKPYPLEHRIWHKTGAVRWVRNTPVTHYSNNELIGYDGLVSDITERKQFESLLKESEEKYRYIINNSPAGIFSRNINGGYNFFNPTLVRDFECTSNEEFLENYGTIEQRWERIEDYEIFKESLLKNKVVKGFEIESKLLNGETRWFALYASLNSTNTEINGFVLNITDRKNAEIALKLSEERFRLVTTLSGHMVYTYSADSDTINWGGAIEQVTGYSPEEYSSVGMKEWHQMMHPDERDSIFVAFREFVQGLKPFHVEYRYSTKNGNYIWIEEECFALYSINGEVKKGVGVMKNVSRQKMLERQVLNSVIETEERERMHFSQELHDGLGPLLSAAKMYVQWLAMPNAHLPQTEILGDMLKILDESSRTVREISFKLSPHILQNFGLVEALKAYVDKVKESAKIIIELNAENICRFDEKAETIIYRVVCECINNTIKHANAEKIWIDLDCNNDNLSVEIADNGQGFDMDEQFEKHTGIGLLNMESRLKSINGQFFINSTQGRGTYVKINIKLQNS